MAKERGLVFVSEVTKPKSTGDLLCAERNRFPPLLRFYRPMLIVCMGKNKAPNEIIPAFIFYNSVQKASCCTVTPCTKDAQSFL